MADISAIKLPNGTTYNLKDITARNAANSAVPNTRTVNGKALSSNISLSAGDVGAYTKKETDTKINAAVASTYKYKGSVTADKLPTSGQVVGDVYNITNDSSYGKAGMNVAWTGTTWDALGSNVDLSNYVTTSDSRLSNARPASDVYAWAKAAKKPSYSASEINGLGSLATKNGLSAGDVGALPTSGGTMTGDIAFAATGATGTSNKISFSGSTDGAQIYYNVPSSDQGNLIFNMTDDTNAYIQFAQNGTVHSYISPADGTYHGNISGSAGSVAWGNVSDKPSTYPPSSHTHTKAQVGLGNVANLDQSKAIKSITRSGTTFTATALDGTTTTFTQQDNNTTYGVATSSADGLMSKSDKAKLDGITSTYATKSELSSHSQNTSNPHKVTASQVGALPLSGGSLTGKLTVPSIETGSADANYFQCKKFRGQGDANTYYHAVDFGYAGHDQVDFYEYGGKYVFHQHTQAAKSSGDTVIGEINSNGFVGKVNGHTVNADVPSGAKFTDTTYSAATQSANGLMSAADKKKLDSYTTGSAGGAVEVTLAAASWSSSTTEINGNNYYTYSVSVANIGNQHPQIFCGGGDSVIPSATQESEFNHIRYALVDTAKSTVTFYSIEKPSVAINVVIKDYLESSIVSGTASVTIATSDWSSTTSTVNGRAFYTAKKTLSSVSSNYPTIICGTADTLPSDAEQTAFDCINYAAADTSTKTVTFYAIQKPTSAVVAIVI